MASSSKKKTSSVLSEHSVSDLLGELSRQYKNVSSIATKASKDAESCHKRLGTIADDLCDVVCDNLIASYNGLKNANAKDNAIASILKPVDTKFTKYCAESHLCDYQNGGKLAKKSSEDVRSSDSATSGQSSHADVGIAGGSDDGAEEL